MISKHRNKFANTVFLNHLRKHPKPGVQNLALKVQKELTKQKELFQLEGNIPSVEEVFKHYVTHTQASVPVKKKTYCLIFSLIDKRLSKSEICNEQPSWAPARQQYR